MAHRRVIYLSGMRALSVLVILSLVSLAQVSDATFEGNPAYVLSNGKLSLTVLKQGTAFASVTMADDPDKLNPLWDAARMTRELGQTPRFNSGTGHFLCVDGFGGVSDEERAAGLTGHGEAHLQNFDAKPGRDGRAQTLTLTATLPIVQESVTRTVGMVEGENVVYVRTQLENLLGFDRPVNWAEHATVGSPFAESGVTVIDISGSRSQTRPYAIPAAGRANNAQTRRLPRGVDFTWPMAPGIDGKTVDMRQIPDNPHFLDHTATLLDPARKLEWISALNPKKHLIVGYIFRRDDFPWLQTWGSYPATGKFARGMEFSTQPYDVPRREAVTAGSMFGTPTYRWLPAKSKIESRFLMFYARVPEGYSKTDDIRIEGGKVIAEDKGSGKRVELAASLAAELER